MNESMKLNQLEIVRTVGIHKPNDILFKIRIPRLMVGITHEKQRITYDKNIFMNSSSCMVYPKNTLVTQNYITVRRAPNCDLSSVTIKHDDEFIIPENTALICACFYDHNALYIIDTYEP